MKPSIRTMSNESPIHEFYRRIKPESLNKCLSDQQYDSKYLQGMKVLRSEYSLNICHVAFDSKNVMPNNNQIKQMADLQYLSSDVIVIPSWFTMVKDVKNRVEEFFKLSDKYYEYASFRNNKPVMASIPVCISTEELPKVIDHYMNMDITSFILDFNSRSMIKTTWVRSFIRELEKYHVEDEGIVYSINASQGVSRKSDGGVCEAQDFLGFGAGVDLLGNKYFAKQSADMYNSHTSVKMFYSDNYTYRPKICTEEEIWKYKSESAKNQMLELNNIRDTIKHSENVLDLVKSKNLSEITMKWLIDQNKMEPRKTALDEFF